MADPRAPEAIGAVLHRRLGELVAELHVRERETRDGVPDGLHQARVTSRRLRAALATFRPVLVRDVTEPIRADLRWLALSLGDARDAEVMRDRLHRLAVEELEPGDADRVTLRVDRALDDLEDRAQGAVVATLAADRFRALLADLDRLVADPPWSDAASSHAQETLQARLAKEWRRLSLRAETARELADHPAAYDEAVHDVRKAAKRLRYAWEVAEPVLGPDAAEQVRATRDVTRLLGERQDIVLIRTLLSRLEADAAADGEPTAPWVRLRRHEVERAAHIASDTLDMLKSGTLSAGVAVREK